MSYNIECPICQRRLGSPRALSQHLSGTHKISNFKEFLKEVYYPKYCPHKNRNCIVCGFPTKLKSFIYGFNQTCSRECTNLSRYGVTCIGSSDIVKAKRKETNLERYGVENVFQLEETKNKIRKTNLENIGFSHHMNSDEVREKIKNNNLEKYGVENPLSLPSVIEKRKQTCLSRYGETTNLKTPETKDKIKATCLERYGTSYPLSLDAVIKKRIRTLKSQHNIENIMSLPETKDKAYKTRRVNYYKMFKKELKLNRKIELLSPEEDYTSTNKTPLNYKCLKCGEKFNSSRIGELRKIFCPNCFKDRKSTYEFEILEFLNQNNVKSFQSTKFEENSQKEIDIYIPDHKLGIEVDGLYWHSERYKSQDYHLKKTEAAESLGIQLLHITDEEWINKREIVKSIILSKLGKFEKRLFARECVLKRVPNKEYKEFLENNHLKGYSPTSVRIGLYHNNQLVQLCSFSKSRFKKDEIELIRHCSLINYQVLGGLSRLLKHYVKNYHDKEKTLITYVDRRYGTPKNYEKSGFVLTDKLSPNYYYFRQDQYYLQSKIKYQKHKLSKLLENFDPSLTEMENMRNHGYRVFYDCGNYKLEYNLC